MHKHNSARQRRLLSISAFFVILTPVLVYFIVSGNKSDAGTKKPSVATLVGDWRQVETDNGIIMRASVNDNNTIQINMDTRDSSGIYWMGSFPSDRDASGNFKTVSLADPDAQKWMAKSLFGSQDSKKAFTYENGEITFKFTILDTTSTVHLVKQ